MICTIIDIALYDMRAFDTIEKIHINLNILATFLYILSFVGLITKTKNRKDIHIIIALSISSMYLLYKANEVTLMYIIAGMYLVLTFFKLQTLPKTKNRKILKSVWSTILIIFLINIFSYNYKRLQVPSDYEQLQQRIIQSKMFGEVQLEADPYLEYVYTNFSNYSFVYLVEHYGKICGMFITFIFMLLFIKLIFNYQQTKDHYGKMLNLGIGYFLIIPFILDFLTRVGIVNFPKINIPFIIHNDMSIILYMVCVSLIMSIYSRKNIHTILSK